jgi:flavorubredoxin
MVELTNDLYQNSSYNKFIDLSFHQYLLVCEQPILFQTGNMEDARFLKTALKEILKEKELKYVFVSHFESDECGGLTHILKEYPAATVLCSEVTARELKGFGFDFKTKIVKSFEVLKGEDFELEFIAYPAEMHLWEGLLAFEKKRALFFSSDLMVNFGQSDGVVEKGNWADLVDTVSLMQVASPEKLLKLQNSLSQLKPKFVATGHGQCFAL